MSRAANQELVDRFMEFFQTYYHEDILSLARAYPRDEKSLWVTAEDLYTFDSDLLDDFQNHHDQILRAAEEALRLYDLPIDVSLSKANIRVTDPAETYIETFSVPDVASEHIGQFVGITGQVEKVTEVNSRLDTAIFVCQRCGVDMEIPQSRGSVQEPYQCESCEREGPFQLDQTRSTFVDQRKIKLKEPPGDRGRGDGRSITVYVDEDLCGYGGEHGLADRAGERATIFGTINIDESQLEQRNPDSEFDHWLNAEAVEFVDDDFEDIDVEAHKEEFTELALGEEGDPVELVKDSIAPQLIATDDTFDTILEASVAWLFNSFRVDPEGRGQFRGDLHMTVIGDPGLGKSTLMSQLASLAPKSEFRSGTGLSKVGLTAAAKQEEFDGKSEWTLSPGILPRANGGHCIIDEVDDVVDEQTKAIHDALEGDQMVKVDKAGIRADLPTRAALLASGNPEDSRFDPYADDVVSQIDMDAALFDRMDLIFALQDQVDVDADKAKADHIVESYDELSRVQAFEEEGVGDEPDAEKTKRPVPADTLRAWIHYAREHVQPLLTDEAKDALKEFYVEVRNLNDGHQKNSDDTTPPATPRTLEAGIRIASAFARVELDDKVREKHAERAKRISRKVVGLNFDPQSGQFDADRTGSGMTATQRQRVNTLKEIISELEQKSHAGAPVEEVLERATDEGIGSSEAEHEIEKLKQKGELYQPSNDTIRTS